MVRLISRQRGGLTALKLTKLIGINDFPAAKDSGKVLIIIIYCYLTIIFIIIIIIKTSPINYNFVAKLSQTFTATANSQICPGLNANEIQIPHGKHHKSVLASKKSPKHTQCCQIWSSNLKMTNIPEVQI